MKLRRIIYTFLTIVVCLLIVGKSIKAQQSLTEVPIVKGDGNAGELNSARLDFLANEQLSTKERVFIIARLGRGETARSLNLKRLKAAWLYLVKTRGIKKEQIILAEGERVANEGRVEFYLGSKLMIISLAQRGRNISFNCCEG